MSTRTKELLHQLRLQARSTIRFIENGDKGATSTSETSGKSGEKLGGSSQAEAVGRAIASEGNGFTLTYKPDEYKGRLIQAKNDRDYHEALQLITEAISAKLPFLNEISVKRDIESVVRGLKENDEIEIAILLAYNCFKNNINYETMLN